MSVSGNFVTGLRTVGRGFLLGTGVCLAVVVFVVFPGYLIEQQVERHMRSAGSEFGMPVANVKDLELIDVEEKKSADRDYIVGTIKNNGSAEFRRVSVEADLFQAGKFVDKYSTDETSVLAAGGTSYFKIECGCKHAPAAEHDSFKTKIVSAY